MTEFNESDIRSTTLKASRIRGLHPALPEAIQTLYQRWAEGPIRASDPPRQRLLDPWITLVSLRRRCDILVCHGKGSDYYILAGLPAWYQLYHGVGPDDWPQLSVRVRLLPEQVPLETAIREMVTELSLMSTSQYQSELAHWIWSNLSALCETASDRQLGTGARLVERQLGMPHQTISHYRNPPIRQTRQVNDDNVLIRDETPDADREEDDDGSV